MLALDPVPSGIASGNCEQCGRGLTLIRASDSVRVRLSDHPRPSGRLIGSELMERVRMALPGQPWPTGIHREIALELGISPSEASHAISELIKKGDFHPQEDGVVLVSEPRPKSDSKLETI